MEFFDALMDPYAQFLRNALWLGLIGALPFGLIGTYVVVRRISYIAAAISHSILGGVGFAVYAQNQWGWTHFDPIYGALLAAIFSALLIGWVSLHFSSREDSAIGIIWVSGMAIGLIFLAKSPGYFDPMSFLFGDILLVDKADLLRVTALTTLVCLVVFALPRQITALALDPEFARIRGLRTRFLHYLMLLLTALTIVLLVQLMGIILVVALLTLPPAIAALRARTLTGMVGIAVGLNALLVFFGLWISYSLDWPSGPVIILLATSIFLFSLWRKAA
jgi:zinc transport system permease protein